MPSEGPSLQQISKNIEELREAMQEILVENRSKSFKNSPKEISTIDLAICVFLELISRMDDFKKQSIDIISPFKEYSSEHKCDFVFECLLVGIVNSTIAARQLAIAGFSHQARAVVRQLSELCDTTLAAAIDIDTFKTMRTNYDDPLKVAAHWRRHLSSGVVRSVLRKANKKWIHDSDLRSDLIKERQRIYSWLSESTHVTGASAVLGSFAREYDSADRFETTIGGRAGVASAGTLTCMVNVLAVFIAELSGYMILRGTWFDSDTNAHLRVRIILAYWSDVDI